MSEYAQRFADLSVLSHITDQDLKDIGVVLAYRRKTLARRAIAWQRLDDPVDVRTREQNDDL